MVARPTTRDSVWLVGLFFGAGASPTGALIESLAVGLAERGYRVEVLAGKSGYNSGGRSLAARFRGPVHSLYSGPADATGVRGRLVSWAAFYLAVVLFVFARPLPRVVVLTTTPPFLHTAFVLRKLVTRSNCRVVLWNQDTYPEILGAVGLLRPTGAAFRALRAVQKWATRRVDRAVALDRAMAGLLRAHGARHCRVIPNWEVPRGGETSPGPDRLDEELDRARKRFRSVLLYSGNYGWGHDLGPLLTWLRERPDQADVYLVCVGGGEKWHELEALAAEAGVGRVYVASYLPGPRYARLLHQIDWGVVTLESGCAGLMSPSKIHAYLAAGKPLVYLGPPESNVADAIDHYGCGHRLGYDDPAGFERVAARIREPAVPYAELSDRAATAARERYSEAAGVGAFGALLDQLTAAGPRLSGSPRTT